MGNGDGNCEAFLSNISLQYNVEVDVWIWDINLDGIISYKEAYALISNFEAVVDSSLYSVT